MNRRVWNAYKAILVFFVSGILSANAVAQNGQYQFVEAAGSWRIYSDLNAVSKQENYFMATLAINNKDAGFLLYCKKEIKSFFFALTDERLKVIPYGQKITVAVRLSNDEPFDVLAAAAGDGSVIVEERLQPPSFSLLLMTLYLKRSSSVGFSIGSYQWFFRIDGFAHMADQLGKHCGFTPDPVRARKGMQGKP